VQSQGCLTTVSLHAWRVLRRWLEAPPAHHADPLRVARARTTRRTRKICESGRASTPTSRIRLRSAAVTAQEEVRPDSKVSSAVASSARVRTRRATGRKSTASFDRAQRTIGLLEFCHRCVLDARQLSDGRGTESTPMRLTMSGAVLVRDGRKSPRNLLRSERWAEGRFAPCCRRTCGGSKVSRSSRDRAGRRPRAARLRALGKCVGKFDSQRAQSHAIASKSEGA
jgi:hypothetical protein